MIKIQQGNEIMEFKKKKFNRYERRLKAAMIACLGLVAAGITTEAVLNHVHCSGDKLGWVTDVLQTTMAVSVALIGGLFIYTAKSQRSEVWNRTWKYVSFFSPN